MLMYYFYNNFRKLFYKVYRDQTILAISFELDFFINSAFYLNKFFFSSASLRSFQKNSNFFNCNFFFLKIKFFNKIFWKFLNLNARSKIWKTLMLFFYMSVSSVVNKSIFLKFSFRITFSNVNVINYFEFNKFLIVKINKQAASFVLFYFLIFLYKPYLVNKFSLFTLSSYKNINFEVFNFLNFIELKSKLKSSYSRWILI